MNRQHIMLQQIRKNEKSVLSPKHFCRTESIWKKHRAAKRIVLGAFISLVALYLAFHNLDFTRIWLTFKATKWSYVVLSCGILITSVLISAFRWQLILQHSKRIPISLLIQAQFIGIFGNNVLPLRMGELLRSYILSKREGIAISEIFGSVVNERFLDILAIISLGIILLLSGLVLPDNIIMAFRVYLVIMVVVIVIVLASFRLKTTFFFSRRLQDSAKSFLRGFQSLRTVNHLPKLALLTLVMWILFGFRTVLILRAVGMNVGIMVVILVLGFEALGIFIPAAPGSIGTYHIAVIIALNEIAGFDFTTSQGAAILLHAARYIPHTLIGMGFFLISSVRLSDIKKVPENINGSIDGPNNNQC